MPARYHQSATGWKRCTAHLRACPLGAEHVNRAQMVVATNQASERKHSFNDVVDQLETYDESHYRLYLPKQATEPVAVNVQSFDYFDYDPDRFLDNTVYKSKGAAVVAAEDFNDPDGENVHTKAHTLYRSRLKQENVPTPFNDVVDQLPTHDAVHYRTYLSSRTNEAKSICVQYFDYFDYDEYRFLDDTAYLDKESADAAADLLNKY